jgi:hypothetical protein
LVGKIDGLIADFMTMISMFETQYHHDGFIMVVLLWLLVDGTLLLCNYSPRMKIIETRIG